MNQYLGDDDCHAVDLVLQRDTEQVGLVRPAPQAYRQRIECVEQVLDVLAHWPVADPPVNLVEKTLLRAEQTAPHRQGPRAGAGQCLRRSLAQ